MKVRDMWIVHNQPFTAATMVVICPRDLSTNRSEGAVVSRCGVHKGYREIACMYMIY